MSDANDVSRPLKTWSHLAKNRRRPTEYEIVSTKLLWSTDDEAPWAMGPEVPLSKWYVQYRNESPLRHADWDGFRDPDQIVYRTYNMIQDGQESHVDGLLDDHSKNEHDSGLSEEWVAQLARLYTPGRYLLHTVQMSAAYLAALAPSSTIENCFIFESGDHLRWVSRVAYRTAELATAHPSVGFGRQERARWEDDEAWQGFRELMERALVAWDWAEQFVAVNLVARPAIDAAMLRALAAVAQENGDTLLALLCRAQLVDSDRTQKWSRALVDYALESDDHGRANRDLIRGWLDKWGTLGDQAIDAYCDALVPGSDLGAEVKRTAASARASLVQEPAAAR
ncbi:toluene monooxygenase [Actinomadura sp. WMMA1423]|uniref:toluene monooxygenase n=1 Tax=Actinomadura sp. WMMA1423 TaxID=2591108 RepID=UPI0011473E07|nr:toluene monooxygenase [Actinomadura sp. WMMA1423]